MKVHRLVFSSFEVNTYIVSDKSNECVIIDPACKNKQEQNYLLNFLKEQRLKPVKLLNTHCHLDHVFGNKFVSDTFNLETEAHKEEEFNITNSVNAANLYGVQMEKPYPVKKFLKEGDKIKFGVSELEMFHVPGHTAGSIVFYNKKEKLAIVGDVLFNGSIGRTDLPGGDFDTLINGIKTKLFKLDDSVTVYPGHGPATSIGKEKQTNPFLSGTQL
ncbi:MAG: MBL fold metallo-hydrolase [Bacteroidales bacterium]|nr:MBL fold metallo-hydrolase [Bacteroidales bacterium]